MFARAAARSIPWPAAATIRAGRKDERQDNDHQAREATMANDERFELALTVHRSVIG
jgi:hypothetical protein